MILHVEDAQAQAVEEGDKISVGFNGQTIQVEVHINGVAPQGLALLRGVPYVSGTAVAEIYKHSSYE